MNRAKRLLGITLVSAAFVAALLIPAASSAVEEGEGRAPWTVYSYPQVRWGTDDRTVYTFDFLIPLWQGDNSILFFNPRFNVDNHDGSEVNFGFGYRHLIFSDRLILGVNGYYDSRHTGWDTRHEQLGVGAEVMTDWVTGRINGYFAVTGPRTGGMGAAGSIYTFRDVGIYYAGGSVEETLSGYDGELGFKVPYLSDYIETWVYAGGYHFEGDYVDPVDGFSSRVEVIPTDFLRLNFEYRNDTLNGDEYYGEVAVAIPFSVENLYRGKNPFAGIGGRLGGDRTLRDRLTEPVRRDIDVRVGRDSDNARVPGVGTLLADVVFVSENAENIAGTRDGTFEHPYVSIDEAMTDPGSGVLRGVTTLHLMNDDSGAGTTGGGTASLDDLMIWGSGLPHPVYGYITNQYLGNPLVGDGLVLSGSGNEVFGVTFTGGIGISTGTANANIHHNLFSGNNHGIDITGGSAVISNNGFSGDYGVYITGGSTTISGNSFGNTRGIYIAGGMAAVAGNTFNDEYGVFVVNGTLGISGNTFTCDTGIWGTGGTSTVTGNTFDCQTGVDERGGIWTVTGNTFNGEYGVYCGGGTSTIAGNEFNSDYGIYTRGGLLTVEDNTFTGDYGLYSTGGTSTLTLNNFNDVYGVFATGGTLTVGESEATGNTFTCNYGIYNAGIVLAATGNTFNVVADYALEDYCGIYNAGGTSTISDNTFGGEYYSHGIYNAGTLTATGNTFTNYNGLYQLFGSSTVSNNAFFNSGIVERTGALTVTGNSFANSGIVVYDGSAVIGTLAPGTGNTFAGGGGAISASGGYVSIIGNTIGTSEDPLEVYGIYLGPGASLMDPIQENDITVNGTGPDAYGIYVDGTVDLSIWGETIDVMNTNGNSYGIYAYNPGTLSYRINVSEISVTGLNAYGIRLDGYRIGAPSGPYYMTMNYLTIDATATGGVGSRAYGIDVSAGYAVQDFTLDWGYLYVTAPSGDARGVNIVAATPFDDGPIAASLNHISANIDGGAGRYFLYLSGDSGGGNSVDWSVNTYTPVGGAWSGNYDVGGYATPGPVWTNIPDGEISE